MSGGATNTTAGGGGAGYGGGAGGASTNSGNAGGGGGSSFVVPGATNVLPATNTGNGQVTITFDPTTDSCPVVATFTG